MLHVHRAERADALVAALGDLLAVPPADPFATEVVSVPTRGMERWLTQRLSARLGASEGRADGVCANVAFPPPRRLTGEAVASASGIDPDADPWAPERAVWPLLEVVDGSLGEDWLRTLADHLGAGSEDDTRRARRFGAVRHLADLYARYALLRPEMVRAWAGGDDRGIPADAAWQAELWRRLRARIPAPSPAERLVAGCERLREEPGLADLPDRLSLFGLTRLPAGHLDVLRALGARRDVHLFLLHPSPRLWERVAGELAAGPPVVRRAVDRTATSPANRLLASWGQDARELQLVLGAAPGDPAADHHHPGTETESTSLLGRIQRAVRTDTPPPGAPLPGAADERPALAPDDDSVAIHACHGRARQVEVVRDAILHLLAGDPTLEPRDVIVMCPDIETFAPLVHATFGAGGLADPDDELDELPADARPPDLRVRLADRSLRQTNPVLGVVAQLIDLAEQRLTASQVLDLADREPVRRRFHLQDDDLARMEDWVSASGIRWGLDAAHRAPFKLGALGTGTWRAGLDRLLVGVTMTEDEHRLFGGVLPLDDVESGAIDLAGRMAELVDRLHAAVDDLSRHQPIDAWAAAIGRAADALTTTTQADAWQRAELQRILDDAVSEATADGTVHPVILAPAEIRALLAERLQGRPTRANFRTGHLTVCTLVPMRSVPHRIVCLLGLDDAAFPRKAPRDGDDLVLQDPHVGDRDPRAEDRQMLLDALLAATDRLIVTYTGNDERTNAPRPPAVPVGELLDVVDRTVHTADGSPARGRVVLRHPLQPFDPRNFTTGTLVRDAPWSFDRVTLAGAQALAAGERIEPGAFLAAPLPDPPAALVEIDHLVKFVERPVRAFLRQRLGIGVGDRSDEVEDALPVELDHLEQWGVGDRLLQARLAGVPYRTAVHAEVARGTLPPEALGRPIVERLLPAVEDIVEQSAAVAGPSAPDPGSIDVRIELPGGRRLSGTVPGVRGDLLHAVTFSRVNPRHRLAAWVRLLALTAAEPGRRFEAVTVGRARSAARNRASVTVARIGPLDPGYALAQLADLVDLRDRGMREPLPLGVLTAEAYAVASGAGADAEEAARREWESPWAFPKEDAEPEHVLVLGGVLTLAELLAEPPRPGESGDGWDPAEGSRFGRLARRMWDGVLAAETVEDR